MVWCGAGMRVERGQERREALRNIPVEISTRLYTLYSTVFFSYGSYSGACLPRRNQWSLLNNNAIRRAERKSTNF